MKQVVALGLTAALTLGAGTASAQGVVPASRQPVTPADTAGSPAPTGLSQGRLDLAPGRRPVASPFRSIAGDFGRFFRADTMRLLVAAGSGAILARMADREVVEESQEHLSPRVFEAGNIGGSFLVQTGASFGTWIVGKATGSAEVQLLGSDLIRAQVLSQGVVQGMKFATRRQRPDGSDRFSFPSGHTASAFATADILQQHYGWKAGVPAYGFASYVAAARMSANKHHLSDVVMGAAVGIAAARTVTIGWGGQRFDLGVAPTAGGAAVMFTKR
ncbi:MAG: phosphatase PAP2 family protein [Vicinamibacterales bacterium]